MFLYTYVHIYSYLHRVEAVVQTCSVKKVFLGISQNSQENTCARVSFLIKLQASALVAPSDRSSRANLIFKSVVLKNFVNFTGGLRPATLLKRDSNAGVFQPNLQHF